MLSSILSLLILLSKTLVTSTFSWVLVIPNSQGVMLSQQRYILDLLTHTKMVDAKPVTTPMASSTNLSAFDGEPFPDHTLFRSTVGALQYLSLTRPDIAFCVNKLSQFMHKPTLLHWQSVKDYYGISSLLFHSGFKFISTPTPPFMPSLMRIGLALRMIVAPLGAIVSF